MLIIFLHIFVLTIVKILIYSNLHMTNCNQIISIFFWISNSYNQLLLAEFKVKSFFWQKILINERYFLPFFLLLNQFILYSFLEFWIANQSNFFYQINSKSHKDTRHKTLTLSPPLIDIRESIWNRIKVTGYLTQNPSKFPIFVCFNKAQN